MRSTEAGVLLESLPYPSNIDNHFTFDPDKYDFYAMDCYRRTGEDAMARMHANEVIRKSTAPDGSLRSPMRASEAHTTLAVVSAREGDLDGAVEAGSAALDIPRQSVPSLLMVTGDLVTELHTDTTTSRPRSTTSIASTACAIELRAVWHPNPPAPGRVKQNLRERARR